MVKLDNNQDGTALIIVLHHLESILKSATVAQDTTAAAAADFLVTELPILVDQSAIVR